MRRSLLVGALACAAMTAWGGEIIFVDPVHEKAQALQQEQGDKPVRHEQLREQARAHLNDAPVTQTTVIFKSGPPPTDAARVRQAARVWVAPPANEAGNRCKTENTVGGIDGTAQGHTVIQSNTAGVTAVCK